MRSPKYRQWLDSGSMQPYLTWCLDQQRKRSNKIRRQFGIKTPQTQHVHYVHLTKIPVPTCVTSLATLSCESGHVWVKSKKVARAITEADRHVGGTGSFTTFEYQRCKVCERMLLGREATDYRERRRWPATRWYWPWGPQCGSDCKPDEKRAAEAIAQNRIKPLRDAWARKRTA